MVRQTKRVVVTSTSVNVRQRMRPIVDARLLVAMLGAASAARGPYFVSISLVGCNDECSNRLETW